MNIAFIAISSEEYFPYYKVLYESLKKHAQYDDKILYWFGEKKPEGLGNTIDITDWYNECNSSYNKLERICSLRARVVLHALDEGYDVVVFLGAKVEFFQYPDALLYPLYEKEATAVVTPHILEPLPEDGKFPNNASVSFTGHISTDIVSFRNCPEIIKFLEWQDEIMKTKVKTTHHTYLDQSWLNFLPFFVDDVKILKDPGYNYAYWRYVPHRFIKQGDKYIILNDSNINGNYYQDLVCFQFSGLPLMNPEMISTHQNRYKAEGYFLEFLKKYAEKVK